MASAAPRARPAQSPSSTDRGGVVLLLFGVLFLSLGIGMALSLHVQTVGVSLYILKFMAHGLGGSLPHVPALFALWLGSLLSTAARRHVSFRSFLASLLFALCLMGFLTMIAPAPGFRSLFDFCLNANTNVHRVSAPDSYAEYISCAYQRFYDERSISDGGALGMLLAFPAWRLLGSAGGTVFLALAAAFSFFLATGLNPVRMAQRMRERKAGSGTEWAADTVSGALQANDPAKQEDRASGLRRDGPVEPVGDPAEVWGNPAAAETDAGQREADLLAPLAQERRAPEGFKPTEGDFVDWILEDEPRATPVKRMEPSPTRPVSIRTDLNGSTGLFEPNTGESLSPSQPPDSPREEAGREISPSEGVPGVHSGNIRPQGRPGEDEAPEPAATHGDERAAVPARAQAFEAPETPKQGGRLQRAEYADGERIRLDGTPMPKPGPKQMRLPITDYNNPPARLLSVPENSVQTNTTEEDALRAEKLLQTLNSFNIPAQVQQIVHGPAITRFAIRLAEGVNVNRLRNVMDNIAVELLAKSPIRAEIPIPGTPMIGIEVSNERTSIVYLSEVLSSQKMRESRSASMVALGKDITGAPVVCELMDMPHLLIAGATGSGKSVCINSIITSLLFRATPDEVRLILVDPKFVELQPYNDIPHLLLPVVTDPKKAVAVLDWVCQEMDQRYRKLEDFGVRNIDAYNRKLPQDGEPLPRIVVIVDEMADLMASCGKAIDEHVKRITAKARAAGICLILATQRPSVDVITGVIKANIPSRIAFQVSSLVDSRTILDMPGAEKLLGFGDMLYLPRNLSAPKRVQGCFLSDREVLKVTEYVKSRNQARYRMDVIEHLEMEERSEGIRLPDEREEEDSVDELLPKAIEMAVEAGQMSISMLQRVLRIGYSRAGRLIDEMEKRGIISGNEGTKPRKTLLSREEYGMLNDEDSA